MLRELGDRGREWGVWIGLGVCDVRRLQCLEVWELWG